MCLKMALPLKGLTKILKKFHSTGFDTTVLGLCCSSEGSKKRKKASSEKMDKPDVPKAESSIIQNITTQQLASSNINDQLDCRKPTATHFSVHESHSSIETERRTTLRGAVLTVMKFASADYNPTIMCFAFLFYALGEEVLIIAAYLVAFYLLFRLAYFFYSNHKSILHLLSNFINLLNTIFQILVWILKILHKLFELLQLLWSSNNSGSRARRNLRHLQRNNRDTSELVLIFGLIIIVIMIIANNEDTTTVNIVK